MRTRFLPNPEQSRDMQRHAWMETLQKLFPQETLQRFFERQDVRKISLAVIMAISGCASKVPDIVPAPIEMKQSVGKPDVRSTPDVRSQKKPQKDSGRLEKKLPLDFKPEITALYEVIKSLTDEDLARAHVSREQLAAALSQLSHVFVKYSGREMPYTFIETRLFRDGIRYFVKWDDTKDRAFGSDDALSTTNEAMKELRERTGGLIGIQQVQSEEEANIVFTFRGFSTDETHSGKKNVGGATYIALKERKLPALGEYMENFLNDIEFNLNKDLMDPLTQNLQILENKTGKPFTGMDSLPSDIQRDIYSAYFKKAVIHETIHRLLGFMDHNDEVPTSIMNSIAHVLLTLTEEDINGEKKIKGHIATDMEDAIDPVNPLIRVLWLVLDKLGALKKDFVPQEVGIAIQYLGAIPIDKHSQSL